MVGCIDCTHVAIVPPPGNNPEMPERAFVNRKGYHSINVQLVKQYFMVEMKSSQKYF